MSLVFLISVAIFSLPSSSWQTMARMETAEHYYYTGVSSPLENEKLAREEAIFQARQAFFIEHFGVAIKLDERSWNSLEKQEITQKLSIEMSRLHLRGEKIEKIERRSSITWVLLSYPKSEVKAELVRRRNLESSLGEAKEDVDEEKTEFWGDGFAQMVVKTEPPGALVYLNGEPIGKTPLHARRLAEGVAELELILPLFQKVKKTVILNRDFALELDEMLFSERGILVLDIEPKGANVKIQDVIDDRAASIGLLSMPAGTHKLSLSHPDYEATLMEVFVSPQMQIFRRIEMTPKPAKLSLVSRDYPFEIELKMASGLKEVRIIENSESFLVDSRFSSLIVQKTGFKVFKKKLNLKPNLAQPLRVDLEKEVEGHFSLGGSSKQTAPPRSLLKNPWFWGGLIGGAILTGVLSTSGNSGSSKKAESPVPSPPTPSASPTGTEGPASGGVRIRIF